MLLHKGNYPNSGAGDLVRDGGNKKGLYDSESFTTPPCPLQLHLFFLIIFVADFFFFLISKKHDPSTLTATDARGVMCSKRWNFKTLTYLELTVLD